MKKYKLGEIADFNVKAISKSDSLQEIIYLDTSSITENVISDTIIINIEDAPSRAQRRVKNNTIIYSTVRPRLKHYGILNNPQTNFIVSTGFVTIDLKEQYKQIIDPRYLYLLLTQSTITEYIGNIADTAVSAYPSINPADISSLSFNFPSFDLQKSVADIWENYDKKIVLNRQINQNLEAMAKQLYDYWFVQFDFPNEEGKPYKSSGGKMVWNDKLKREIPSCFDIANMGKLCKFRNGINYSKDEIGNEYQIVNVRNISSSNILLDGEDFDTITIPMSKAENYSLKSDDIIIARSGCPGSTRLLLEPSNTLFCGFIICCTPNNSSMRNYLTYCLKQLEGTNATTSGGSILQNVSQDTLKGLHIIVPNKRILEKFNEVIEQVFNRMLNCLKENNNLIKQRDELLPLLMNGQVSVNSDLSDD